MYFWTNVCIHKYSKYLRRLFKIRKTLCQKSMLLLCIDILISNSHYSELIINMNRIILNSHNSLSIKLTNNKHFMFTEEKRLQYEYEEIRISCETFQTLRVFVHIKTCQIKVHFIRLMTRHYA